MTFGDLEIAYDERVLKPRPWTTMQAEWAAELLAGWPAGPALELGAGAGQIGLLALHRLGNPARRLVSVDDSVAACELARVNAEAAGLADRVDVRQADLAHAAGPDELFALIVADPPWVPTGRTQHHPEDPQRAIDGGRDGLAASLAFARTAARHLLPGGAVLLQLGAPEQAYALAHELRTLTLAEIRFGAGGIVALLRPTER